MTKSKNGWDKFLKYVGLVAPTIWIAYQILFTSQLTEAQKYFTITMIIIAYVIGYIKFVIEPKIKQ